MPSESVRRLPAGLLVALLLLLLTAAGVVAANRFGPGWMERLAANEPDPMRRRVVSDLRTVRAALNDSGKPQPHSAP